MINFDSNEPVFEIYRHVVTGEKLYISRDYEYNQQKFMWALREMDLIKDLSEGSADIMLSVPDKKYGKRLRAVIEPIDNKKLKSYKKVGEILKRKCLCTLEDCKENLPTRCKTCKHFKGVFKLG